MFNIEEWLGLLIRIEVEKSLVSVALNIGFR